MANRSELNLNKICKTVMLEDEYYMLLSLGSNLSLYCSKEIDCDDSKKRSFTYGLYYDDGEVSETISLFAVLPDIPNWLDIIEDVKSDDRKRLVERYYDGLVNGLDIPIWGREDTIEGILDDPKAVNEIVEFYSNYNFAYAYGMDDLVGILLSRSEALMDMFKDKVRITMGFWSELINKSVIQKYNDNVSQNGNFGRTITPVLNVVTLGYFGRKLNLKIDNYSIYYMAWSMVESVAGAYSSSLKGVSEALVSVDSQRERDVSNALNTQAEFYSDISWMAQGIKERIGRELESLLEFRTNNGIKPVVSQRYLCDTIIAMRKDFNGFNAYVGGSYKLDFDPEEGLELIPGKDHTC